MRLGIDEITDLTSSILSFSHSCNTNLFKSSGVSNCRPPLYTVRTRVPQTFSMGLMSGDLATQGGS